MSIIKTLNRTKTSNVNFNDQSNVIEVISLDKENLKATSTDEIKIFNLKLIELINNLQKLNPDLALNLSQNIINNIEYHKNDKVNEQVIINESNITSNIDEFTGLISTKPELILSMNFDQLYNGDDTNTDIGHYANLKIDAYENKIKQINELFSYFESNESKKIYPDLSSKIIQLRSDFKNKINDIKNSTDFLTKLLKSFNNVKEIFSIRDLNNEFTIDAIISQLLNEQSTNNNIIDVNDLILNLSKSGANPTSLVNQLYSTSGYNLNNIKKTYTSTKVWLQACYEFKNLLENSTSRFTINNDIKSNDNNSITLNDVSNDLIKIYINSPEYNRSLILANIMSMQQNEINSTLTSLNEMYSKLYANIQQNDIERLLFTISTISKEFRYSVGLSRVYVKYPMFTNYDYNVSNTNQDIFEYIIGKIQKDIYTNVQGNNKSSLCSLAYDLFENSTILNFESGIYEKYNDNFITAPQYYVDNILNDGVAKLEKLLNRLTIVENTFKQMTIGLNLLCLPNLQNGWIKDATINSMYEILNNPTKIYEYITNIFMGNGLNPMLALLAESAHNEKIKVLLLILCLGEIIPGGIDSDVKNQLLTNLLDTLQFLKIDDKILKSQQVTSILINEIKFGTFLQSTFFTNIITILKEVLYTFTNNREALNNSFSRYSGINDTSIMMLLFDAIITCADKLTRVRIGGINVSKVSKTQEITINIADSTNKILKNLKSSLYDDNFKLMGYYVAFIGTIQTMRLNIRKFLQYYALNDVQDGIKQFFSLLPQDRIKIKGFTNNILTEQQLLSNIANVNDIRSRIFSKENQSIITDGICTKNEKVLFQSIFKTKEIQALSPRSRILTIGLPYKFSQIQQQKLSFTQLGESKERDIVTICVHKIDMLLSDIIFNPVKFKFELSKYPLRNTQAFQLQTNRKLTLDEIIGQLGIRDSLQNTKRGKDLIYYRDLNNTSKIINEEINLNQVYIERLFDDTDYAFLSKKDRNDILLNHIMSYALELYMLILGEINVSEFKFTKFISDLKFNDTNQIINDLIRYKLNELQNTSSIDEKKINDMNTLINNVDSNNLSNILNLLSNIHYSLNNLSILTSKNDMYKLIFTPKIFDRIFNLIIDPTWFSVDIQQMNQMTNGKNILKDYLNKGELISTNINRGLISTQSSEQVIYARNKINNDAMFEKYFVTFE